MKYKSILLIGPPGTGKTSIGHIFDKLKGYKHYSIGEELRNLISQHKLSPKIAKYMNEGLAIPANLLVQEVKKIISNYIKNGLYNPNKDILLLDGSPRDEKQLIKLEKYFDIYKVFLFSVNNNQVIFQRIKSKRDEKRSDDPKDNIIQKRIDVFNQEVDSILSHFDKRQIIIINSEENTIDQMVDIIKMNL